MKNCRVFEILAICIGSAILTGVSLWSMPRPKAEYEIDLIDQDNVEIYSVDRGRTYYTTPDSIEFYLEIDNL